MLCARQRTNAIDVQILQLHHLKEFDSDGDHWIMKLALQSIGFLAGFTVIFLLGWFESALSATVT